MPYSSIKLANADFDRSQTIFFILKISKLHKFACHFYLKFIIPEPIHNKI